MKPQQPVRQKPVVNDSAFRLGMLTALVPVVPEARAGRLCGLA